jgi:hypothetical protein
MKKFFLALALLSTMAMLSGCLLDKEEPATEEPAVEVDAVVAPEPAPAETPAEVPAETPVAE